MFAFATTFALALGLARSGFADMFLRLQAPHVVRAPAAMLDADVTREVDAAIDAAAPATPDELVTFALKATGARLHFGLGHQSRLAFTRDEREGNCIEYAHLFAAIANRAAARKGVGARAWVVHSDARVLGQKLAGRGMADHDWVLVVPSAREAARFYVDPSFYDAGLPWNIAGSVTGDVRVR